ncbi:MAG: class I SAM-dependent methyltransferase [Bdellovibrionales bacterium]|nr:class I SAM-dependent methyltransferase [Bdellovibrionales bacterium]
MIQNRLKKNLARLKSWLQNKNVTAFRLYDRDIPEFPFIVDIYESMAIVAIRRSSFDTTDEIDRKLKELIDGVRTLFPNIQFEVKERQPQKGKTQYIKKKKIVQRFSITENNCQFWIDPYTYLDTGLFLDHRPLRQWIKSQSQDKDFLNLFCYTGSVSVAAALGGARSTTNVDLSSPYLNWARENFELNNISLNRHKFINESALDFLKRSVLQSKKYDLIYLDPPTFSNSKKMDSPFEVEQDQEFLVRSCMKLLTNEGVLYFSNNKRSFKLSPTLSNKYLVKDVSKASIPQDYRDLKIHHCFEIRHKLV